jgi:hypothetical protein
MVAGRGALLWAAVLTPLLAASADVIFRVPEVLVSYHIHQHLIVFIPSHSHSHSIQKQEKLQQSSLY